MGAYAASCFKKVFAFHKSLVETLRKRGDKDYPAALTLADQQLLEEMAQKLPRAFLKESNPLAYPEWFQTLKTMYRPATWLQSNIYELPQKVCFHPKPPHYQHKKAVPVPRSQKSVFFGHINTPHSGDNLPQKTDVGRPR
jgi:hypothetical protein